MPTVVAEKINSDYMRRKLSILHQAEAHLAKPEKNREKLFCTHLGDILISSSRYLVR